MFQSGRGESRRCPGLRSLEDDLILLRASDNATEAAGRGIQVMASLELSARRGSNELVMSGFSRLARLQESIKLYEETIESFERARDRMRLRRKEATDSVMVIIDERLALNQRTLDLLNGMLAAAKEELHRVRSQGER